MECEAAPQLPDLGLGYGVPPAQGLHGEGQEGQTLSSAVLLGTPELPIVREVEGIPRFDGLPIDCCVLERAGQRDIQGSVLTSSPVGYEDISRPPIGSGEEEATFFDRAKACICSREKDSIVQSSGELSSQIPLRSKEHGPLSRLRA